MIQICLLSYALTSLLAMCIVEVHGLSKSIKFGAVLQSIGSVMRALPISNKKSRMIVAFTAQAIIGSCQGFFINTPAEFSRVWFCRDQRLLATSISVNVNTLGITGAYVLGGITKLLLSNSGRTSEEVLCLGLVFQALVGMGIGVIVCLWFGDRPDGPSSTTLKRVTYSANTTENEAVHKVFMKILYEVYKALLSVTFPGKLYALDNQIRDAPESMESRRSLWVPPPEILRKRTGRVFPYPSGSNNIFNAIWGNNGSITGSTSEIRSSRAIHIEADNNSLWLRMPPNMISESSSNIPMKNDASWDLYGNNILISEQELGCKSIEEPLINYPWRESQESLGDLRHMTSQECHEQLTAFEYGRPDISDSYVVQPGFPYKRWPRSQIDLSYWSVICAFTASEIVINVFSSDAPAVMTSRSFSEGTAMCFGGTFILTSVFSSAVFCYHMLPSQMRSLVVISLIVLLLASVGMYLLDEYRLEMTNLVYTILYGSAIMLMGIVVGPIQGLTVELAAETSYPNLNENLSATVLQITGNFLSSFAVGGISVMEKTKGLGLCFSAVTLCALIPFSLSNHDLTRSIAELKEDYNQS